MSACLYLHVSEHVCLCVSVCMCLSGFPDVFVFVCLNMFVFMCVYLRVCPCVCVCVSVFVCIGEDKNGLDA